MLTVCATVRLSISTKAPARGVARPLVISNSMPLTNRNLTTTPTGTHGPLKVSLWVDKFGDPTRLTEFHSSPVCLCMGRKERARS